MTTETYDFINQDLNTLKRIFLETIHVYYAKLTNQNIETQKRSFSTSVFAYFAGETILLDKSIVNAENYGNLNIACTRNFMTGDEGLARLKNFFEETKNCQTVNAFMDVVADYYDKHQETKFAATLSIAAAKAARIEIKPFPQNPDKTIYINLTDPHSGEFNFVNLFREKGDKIIISGGLILKQIKNTLKDVEESFQQAMFRKLPTIYTGDINLQSKCDLARKLQYGSGADIYPN